MAFIGLKIPHETARLLAQVEVDGEKSDLSSMHITMIYLGKNQPIEAITKATQVAFEVTSRSKPFMVETKTVSSFPPNPEDGIPIIALVESEPLHALRDALTAAFDAAGVSYDKKFPEYRPHVTLAYKKATGDSEVGLEAPPDQTIPTVAWGAGEMVLWGGDKGDEKLMVTFPFALALSKSAMYRAFVRLACAGASQMGHEGGGACQCGGTCSCKAEKVAARFDRERAAATTAVDHDLTLRFAGNPSPVSEAAWATISRDAMKGIEQALGEKGVSSPGMRTEFATPSGKSSWQKKILSPALKNGVGLLVLDVSAPGFKVTLDGKLVAKASWPKVDDYREWPPVFKALASAVTKKLIATVREPGEKIVQEKAKVVEPPVAAPTGITVEDVTRRLRGISLGPAGRVRGVEFEGGPYLLWSIEPQNRQRLDHYVGQNYHPGEDDDPEGWDQEGWEDDYAGPVRKAAQAWLDQAFGKGNFEVDVGEKGHVEVQPTTEGKKALGL